MASKLETLTEGLMERSYLHSDIGLSVAEVSRLNSDSFTRSRKGSILKSADAAWYVFDNLSQDQAEALLTQHGDHGTYLVSHFHKPESYSLSIRLSEEGHSTSFKHFPIGKSGTNYHTQGISGDFPSIESVVKAMGTHLRLVLVPIFHRYNQDTSDFEITTNEEDKPPDYKVAAKFPEAAKKPLPLIVPVYPTLRRMMKNQHQSYDVESSGQASIIDSNSTGTPVEHGCCWKAFHTDVNGKWYKPHKAGPITGCLLVIGWIIFLVLFGWIVGLAMILVLFLILCACLFNFICTGRCVDEPEEEGERDAIQERRNRPPPHPSSQAALTGTAQ